MRKANEKLDVIGILLSDIHLSLKPPIWRSAELNWFNAMKRPLQEVTELSIVYDCPVICAGDVFESWNSSPELINFALEYLPKMYAIPGQHDLPLHNYNDLHRSAYLTLVHAGGIKNLPPGLDENVGNTNIVLHGFPFGYKIKPSYGWGDDDDKIHIAVIHEYVWIVGHAYPKAPANSLLDSKKMREVAGYDVAVYGDNHKGFLTGTKDILNCGSLMRRHSDEIDYVPQVGLLLSSGKIKIHYLDTSKDKHLDTIDTSTEREDLDMSSFIRELELLEDTALDFVTVMKRFLEAKKTPSEIKKVILRAMES